MLKSTKKAMAQLWRCVWRVSDSGNYW